jgi:hypothetical protein
MLTTPGRSLALAVLVVSVVSADTLDRQSRSRTIAKQLSEALSQQKLDAIAAQDPDEPDRFIAALLFADTQLLVVSARYASPSLLQARLAHKQYRDIYLDLQSSPIPNSSIFFQDMKADGLCSRCEQTADIVYDGSPAPKIFDGDWDKAKLSEQAYEQRFVAADQQYSRLLQVLLAQLQGTS